MMTIPSGSGARILTDERFQFFYCKTDLSNLGAVTVKTPSGMDVVAYDVERTLCDCIRHIERLDRDLILSALKQYMRSTGKDNAKFLRYAETFRIREAVYRYMEVLI
jgi:hypothetical protein